MNVPETAVKKIELPDRPWYYPEDAGRVVAARALRLKQVVRLVFGRSNGQIVTVRIELWSNPWPGFD